MEFHDEKARVKTKSLTHEREFEFRYDQVAEILYQSHASKSQMAFSVVVLSLFSGAFVFFLHVIYANPWLPPVMRALYLLAALLVLFSFLQRRYYYFMDNNRKALLGMKVNARNYKSIADVIELVARKSGNPRELAFDHPFPEAEPLFVLSDHDIPNYFNRYQSRFYEEELVEFGKSLINASVISHRYDRLSGRIERLKLSSASWTEFFQAILAFFLFLAGFYRAFNIPRTIFLSVAGILAVLLILSFVMKYIKDEVVAFYDRSDRAVYFIRIKPANREKVEAIVQFVRSKIPAAADD